MPTLTVDVTAAIHTARLYLESVFAPEGIRGIRLEEAALSDDDRFWLITFSFDRSEFGGSVWTKIYRIVKIDASSGQTRGVQIRELA